ncbi:DUF6509 family protein [Bacillus weihaiensis]|uniref:Pullulanase n=1 Tax=Bacillus weihaiensis TaxID=1547283 RepID=A0A1L3MT44_9BACI|nr:DUF6509 family protein [Bacillus weihaiensis]APH05460.1 pullulanase [Bacillus weihaiensis]
MNIIEATIEKLDDPFGILTGDRYEIFLMLDVDQDDDLFSENGMMLKLIVVVEQSNYKIAQYDFIEKSTEKIVDFALDEEEKEPVLSYCKKLIAVEESEKSEMN